jgi:hypothetical protein
MVTQAEGNEWKRDLLFDVPRDHPEMQRLAGRYQKCALPMSTCREAIQPIIRTEYLRCRTTRERTAV